MPDGNKLQMPIQSREAAISAVSAESRTASLVWSTGARVKRRQWIDWDRYQDYWEELSLDPAHVRMDRLRNGAPLLNTHSRWSLEDVLGVVEKADISRDGATATVRFSERETVEPIFRDVQSKIIRNVSVGYATYKVEKLPADARSEGLPIHRAIDWEPMELSLVPIGADAGAGVRAGEHTQQRSFPCEFIEAPHNPAVDAERKETSMKTAEQLAAEQAEAARRTEEENRRLAEAAEQARTAERERVTHITELCARHNLPAEFRDGLVKDGNCTLDQARTKVLDKLAEVTRAAPVQTGITGIETVSDETDNRRAAMVNALLHRANPAGLKLEDHARQWRGYNLRELMRRCLELRGVKTEGMSVNQMWERTFQSGSDLPAVVLDAANKSLRAAYESSPRTFVPWTRRATAPDFKTVNRVQLSGAPSLLEVKSGGEIKRGALTDGKETYALATYARIMGINRQTIINDDLGAFTRLPELAGRAAADLESDVVYGIVTANGTMNTTGAALFSTTHANLTTGTANAVINVDNLAIGRKAMRVQTGLEGRPLNLAPRYLLVPATLESLAEQYTSGAYQANASSAINPFAQGGRNPLVPIAEPRLDSNSLKAWYLAADPMQIDTIEYAYLEGEEGVYLESRMGWDIDGMELKARLDFAAGALDYRGLYKNKGEA